MARTRLGKPVEIEFAVRLPRQTGELAEFGFLQIRPLVLSQESEELRMENAEASRVMAHSTKVLGNGRIENLRDIVVVDSQRFERGQSQEVARLVSYFNAKLNEENRPYLLVEWAVGLKRTVAGDSGGVGRNFGGARDRRGGIPGFPGDAVAGQPLLPEFDGVPGGLFHGESDLGEGSVDWAWLAAQPAMEERGCVRHLRFAEPLLVLMNGRTSQGMIFKPE